MGLNILPFVVEAIGYNKSIYPDIDKLYQTRKYEFYKAARGHELYTHQIVTEGGLLQEEYCKKALGILLCADEGIMQKLNDIFRKGWAYAYLFIKNHTEVDLSKFLQRLVRKQGSIDKVSDDFINTNLFICFYLAISSGKKVVEDELYRELLSMLKLRFEHYNADCPERISLKNAPPSELEKVRELKRQLYGRYGVIRDMNTLIKRLGKKTEEAALLFDFEQLSVLSITDGLPFDEIDIEEILLVYVVTHESYTLENVTQYLMHAMYVKYMAKAYKEVKQRYFENNKETMFVELEGLEKELAATKIEIKSLQSNLKESDKILEVLRKKNARLKKELDTERRNRQELNSLREFMFDLDSREAYPNEAIDFDKLKSFKAVLIGGHEKWQARMKELLPEFVFIHPGNHNFDLRLLDGVDMVFIYVNYLNHAVYDRTMEAVRGKDIKITYINQQNEDIVLKEIYRAYGQL